MYYFQSYVQSYQFDFKIHMDAPSNMNTYTHMGVAQLINLRPQEAGGTKFEPPWPNLVYLNGSGYHPWGFSTRFPTSKFKKKKH